MKITNKAKRAADRVADRLGKITKDKFEFDVKLRGDVELNFYTEPYFKYVDQGVKGIKSGSSKAGYKYKKPYNIPASSFSKYTSNTSEQFAIARSVENKGIKAKEYIKDFIVDRDVDDLVSSLGKIIIIDNI